MGLDAIWPVTILSSSLMSSCEVLCHPDSQEALMPVTNNYLQFPKCPDQINGIRTYSVEIRSVTTLCTLGSLTQTNFPVEQLGETKF